MSGSRSLMSRCLTELKLFNDIVFNQCRHYGMNTNCKLFKTKRTLLNRQNVKVLMQFRGAAQNGNGNNIVELQYERQKRLNKDVAPLDELVRDFLDPADFFEAVKQIGVEFYCGVPDSLLKDYCAYITSNVSSTNHVIAVNEGSAVALAAGYHLATNKYGLVYMQNSGLGNAVNPLMSLVAPEVYSIPMLLLIGWRGEPGKRDEPQHRVQGQATPGLLAALGIPFQPLPDYIEGARQALQTAKQHMETMKGPYAFLVKRQTFLPYKLKTKPKVSYEMSREQALKCIVDNLHERDVVVGTTGMLSRELYEYRVTKGQGHEKDFLTVGSMGHASAIATSIALLKPNRQVFCMDGDGAAIMHMGSMATIGHQGPTNFRHIIINNGAHDSVGGQPTDAANPEVFDFSKIAIGCGYKRTMLATNKEELIEKLKDVNNGPGPVLLEVRVSLGSRKDLGRPGSTPLENKANFMHFLAIH